MAHTSLGHTHTETSGQMGKWAPYYDWLMKLFTLGRERALREMTLDLAQVRVGDHVLEVGCGTGTLTLAAKARVGEAGRVYGIDAAPEMIAFASRKAARARAEITFQVGSIDHLSFGPGEVDVILCSFMIYHMPDETRTRGLAEIARVLKPGGRVLVLDLGPRTGGHGHMPSWFVSHTRHDIRQLVPEMEKVGLVDVQAGPARYSMLWYVLGHRRAEGPHS